MTTTASTPIVAARRSTWNLGPAMAATTAVLRLVATSAGRCEMGPSTLIVRRPPSLDSKGEPREHRKVVPVTTTVPISPTDTLGSIVTTMPSAARVLERLGLDYCCHGQRTLADACAEAALDVDEVIDQIGSGSDREPADWATMTAAELADHIEATHHRFLHDELPRLTALADKVRAERSKLLNEQPLAKPGLRY